MQNFLTPLLVVAVALIAEDGRVLMQKRPFRGVHGGLWEFPGGKVEPGESPEITALREIAEELGVELDATDLEPVGFASGPREGEAGESPLVILLYMSRRWRGEPRCIEGEAIAWHGLGAIHDLAMPPLDYPLARALEARLHGNRP